MKFLYLILINALSILFIGSNFSPFTQDLNQWSNQQRIPNYEYDANPPHLIADQNKTVHAFAYQQVGEGESEIAIIYNQWTLEQGWTPPVDILLSPIKNQARLLDVALDATGLFHVLFFGGDDTEANVYYSKAPAVSAGKVQSWSKPVLIGKNALTPENGGIGSDDKGNLVIVYSGNINGRGWYTANSADGGDTWTEPIPLQLTNDNESTPTYLQLSPGQSGQLHAIWTINDIENHGKAIYYSAFDFDSMQWKDPVQVARSKGALGTLAPAIINYHGGLFLSYYDGMIGKQLFRRSMDGGHTWTEPITPFPHVGLNGPGFFIVDANDNLHYFWGQRITGSPDIHGMWHTVWQNDRWSAYESIVSGPRISDETGDQAFDPVSPSVAMRQGNVLLVTWRSDYGLKGNGVWYSYKILDFPELKLLPFPTQSASLEITPIPDTTPAVTESTFTATPILPIIGDSTSNSAGNPAKSLVLGIIPAILLISLFIIIWRFLHNNRL